MEEIELTFLLKNFPEGFENALKKEILDIYIPAAAEHPDLRIRKAGDSFEITRKRPTASGDPSIQLETTIELSKEEFEELEKLPGKRSEKTRYYFEDGGVQYEIAVFSGALAGLVLVDVEFGWEEARDKFQMPSWCLANVTEEKFLAGGWLAGKTYADIEEKLTALGYQKIG